jgi:hypothetical protein
VLTAAAAALRAMAEADPSRAPEPGTAPADAARPPADPPPAVQTIEIA